MSETGPGPDAPRPGGTRPEKPGPGEAEPGKGDARSVLGDGYNWASRHLATTLTAVAALFAIIVFLTGVPNLPAFVEWIRGGGEAELQEEDRRGREAGVSDDVSDDAAAVGARSAQGDAQTGTEPPAPVVFVARALDETGDTHPLQVTVEAATEPTRDVTRVALNLVNQGPTALAYLHEIESELRSARVIQPFFLRTASGELIESSGHIGPVPHDEGSNFRLWCVTLDPAVAGRIVLDFPGVHELAGAALVHAPDPGMIRYRECLAKTVTLPSMDVALAPAR